MMCLALIPNISSNSLGFPLFLGTPDTASWWTWMPGSPETAAHMASPMPPSQQWSSTVITQPPVAFALDMMVAASRGLMVNGSMTQIEIPCWERASAAAKASDSNSSSDNCDFVINNVADDRGPSHLKIFLWGIDNCSFWPAGPNEAQPLWGWQPDKQHALLRRRHLDRTQCNWGCFGTCLDLPGPSGRGHLHQRTPRSGNH